MISLPVYLCRQIEARDAERKLRQAEVKAAHLLHRLYGAGHPHIREELHFAAERAKDRVRRLRQRLAEQTGATSREAVAR